MQIPSPHTGSEREMSNNAFDEWANETKQKFNNIRKRYLQELGKPTSLQEVKE